MTRIFKYTLPAIRAIGRWKLALAKGAKVQSVQVQYNQPVLYALVDEDTPIEEIYIRVYHTGEEMVEVNQIYLGTAILNGGTYVLHYYKEV